MFGKFVLIVHISLDEVFYKILIHEFLYFLYKL